jgi:hypothetical protein
MGRQAGRLPYEKGAVSLDFALVASYKILDRK